MQPKENIVNQEKHCPNTNLINESLSIDLKRKMLIKIDMKGIHGTKGTPQNLGSFAYGTKSQSPPVDKAQIGSKIAYQIHPSLRVQ